jgi:hypothetical protein
MTDLMVIIGLTLASCVAVGLIGFALLHLVRYRSLRQQLTIATLLPVVAVATTVLINVQLMFLSAHDSLVILIALRTSLLLAALGARLVVRRISHASRRVGAGLHQLVSDSASGTPVETARSAEALLRPESSRCWTTWLKPAEPWQSRGPGSGQPSNPARNWSVSCLTTYVRRWQACGLCRRGLEDGVIDDVPRAMTHLRVTGARMTGGRPVRTVAHPRNPENQTADDGVTNGAAQ